MKSKTTEANSSNMSKRSTKSAKKSSNMSKRSTESAEKSSSDEIYKKYNINERLIKIIDGDENKIKILLKEIYKRKKEELKELQRTPYTKED